MLGIEPPGADQELVDASPLPPDPNPMQQPSGGAEGTGGRTGIGQQSGRLPSGGEGSIGRGSLPEQPLSDLEPAPFTSRMDRIGAGAEGTGGRTSPSQQPAGVVTGAGPAARAEDSCPAVVHAKEKKGKGAASSTSNPRGTRARSPSARAWNSPPTTASSSSSSTTSPRPNSGASTTATSAPPTTTSTTSSSSPANAGTSWAT